MKAARTVVAAILGIAAAAVLLIWLFAATPPAWPNTSVPFKLVFSVSSAVAVLYSGAVVLFLMGLSVYKKALRIAYVAICIGILLKAGGTLLLPFGALGWLPAFWSSSGLSIVPFVFSGIFGYIGSYRIGKLIGLKSICMKAYLAIPTVLVLSIATIFLPHVHVDVKPEYYAANNLITAWISLFALLNGLLVLAVRRRIGTHYAGAMTILAWAFLASWLITGISLIHSLIAYSTNDWVQIVLLACGAVVGLLYIAAGYAFRRTKEL